jgi:hypothetical protein
MTKRNNFMEEPKKIRDSLQVATDLADQIHELEKKLISQLVVIDSSRYYVRYGFNSLRGYCNRGLLFSLTQSQRIATLVRRPASFETLTPNDDIQLRD